MTDFSELKRKAAKKRTIEYAIYDHLIDDRMVNVKSFKTRLH